MSTVATVRQSKFAYYIVSTYNGDVKGTNDERVAKSFAQSEDDFVIESLTGKWMQADDTDVEIPEIVYDEELHAIPKEEEFSTCEECGKIMQECNC